MHEINSLCTDSRALRSEYCTVGIPQNTAIYKVLVLVCYVTARQVTFASHTTVELVVDA